MRKRILTSSLLTSLVILLSLSLGTTALAVDTNPAKSSPSFKSSCMQARAGYAQCLSLISSSAIAAPASTGSANMKPDATAPGGSAPYTPTNLRTAYNLSGTAPNTQTVAIVDAYDDPNAESDLSAYRSYFGLPACTTSNGCFKKVDENGGTSYPSADSGWAEEISLDLDMVSAICSNCQILLVEASTASFTDLGAAVNTAVRLGANEVSNSYGGGQSSSDSSTCKSYYNHSGVAITVSSGDSGLGVEVPADCPHVVAIGGTTLNSDGTETTWNTSSSEGAGGGCSSHISKPSWEKSSVTKCSKRAVADVSAVADPNTGVAVYDTYQLSGSGWYQFGGTSVSSPIIAAVYALAGGVSGDAASVPWSKYTSGCLNKVSGKTYSYQGGLGSPHGTSCL